MKLDASTLSKEERSNDPKQDIAFRRGGSTRIRVSSARSLTRSA